MRHVARVAWHARRVESTDQRRLHCPQTTARVYAEFLVVRRFLLLRWTPRTPLKQWLLAALLCLLRCDRKKRCAALGAITQKADECRLHDVRFTSMTKTGCKRPPQSRWHAAGLTFACQSWAPPKRKEENNKLLLPPLSSCPRSCRTQRPPNCPTRRFA